MPIFVSGLREQPTAPAGSGIQKRKRKMKTYGELKAFVEKVNAKYEMHPLYHVYEHYNPFTGEWEKNKILIGYEFGIENIAGRKGASTYIYTWFQCDVIGNEELNDNSTFFFRNKYNWASGREEKGVMVGINAEMTMERRMAR